MRFSIALILAGMFAAPSGAFAKGQEEAHTLAVCAWQKVPQTAAVLAKISPKKRVLYDDASASNAAPFMRVYAACGKERSALSAAVVGDSGSRIDKSQVSYMLLTALRKAIPVNIPEDTFTTPVFRCESRFPDQPSGDLAAKIWWGYGEDPFTAELDSRAQLFNNQVQVTAADFAVLEGRGGSVRNLYELLKKAEEQQVFEVETYATGMASGKAFKIKPTKQNSACRTVSPTGELTNA